MQLVLLPSSIPRQLQGFCLQHSEPTIIVWPYNICHRLIFLLLPWLLLILLFPQQIQYIYLTENLIKNCFFFHCYVVLLVVKGLSKCFQSSFKPLTLSWISHQHIFQRADLWQLLHRSLDKICSLKFTNQPKLCRPIHYWDLRTGQLHSELVTSRLLSTATHAHMAVTQHKRASVIHECN